MKKIIDFIIKELNIIFESYETKSDDSFFIDLFHIILWGSELCLLIFGYTFFIVSIIISFGSDKFQVWAFLLTFGALGVAILFKRIRVLLFFKKDD